MVVDLIRGWPEHGKVAPVELHRWLVSEFRVGKSTAGWALRPGRAPARAATLAVGLFRGVIPTQQCFPRRKDH